MHGWLKPRVKELYIASDVIMPAPVSLRFISARCGRLSLHEYQYASASAPQQQLQLAAACLLVHEAVSPCPNPLGLAAAPA